MPSRPHSLDSFDWQFVLRRTGFLLLGSLATIAMTVWIPAIQELDAAWVPLLVMAITALAELVHRWVRDGTRDRPLFILVAICGLLAGSSALADQPTLVISPSGYSFLVIDEDGTPAVVPVERIVDLTGDSPAPRPELDPEPESGLVRSAKGWAASENDPAGAQALSIVYRQVAESVASGAIPVDSAIDSVRRATDDSLAKVEANSDWKTFRGKVSDAATDRIQRGELRTRDQMVAFLEAIRDGLELSADGANAIGFAAVIGITAIVSRIVGVDQ